MRDHQRKVARSRSPVRQRRRKDTQKVTTVVEQERGKTIEEKSKVSELACELDSIKSQLKRQNSLTEMYSNCEKEAKRELERVLNTLMTKKRKRLQKDYDELHEAYKVQQAELQKERQRNIDLQEEIERLRGSKREVCPRYHDEILEVRLEKHTLHKQLKSVVKRMSKDPETTSLLRAEPAALRQRFAGQKRGEKDCVGLPRKAEKRKLSLNGEGFLNSELSAKRQGTEESWCPPGKKKRRLQQTEKLNLQPIQPQRPEQRGQESIFSKRQRDEQQEPEAISALLNDSEALEDDEDSETEENGKRFWKTERHFPAFKKLQAWKLK